MADERYNRWQGHTIGQFSVAIALISGVSLAGLGAGFSALQSQSFHLTQSWRWPFFVSLLFLLFSLLLSSGAVVTRLLDFRLTARKVRKDSHPDYTKSLKIFGLDKDAYGNASWLLFWVSCVAFLVGLLLLVVSLAAIYSFDEPSAVPSDKPPSRSVPTGS